MGNDEAMVVLEERIGLPDLILRHKNKGRIIEIREYAADWKCSYLNVVLFYCFMRPALRRTS